LATNLVLRELVEQYSKATYSPEKISGRLNVNFPDDQQVDGAEVRWAARLDATMRVLVVRLLPPGWPGVARWRESSRCSSASPPS
jgi:hypothetical protein